MTTNSKMQTYKEDVLKFMSKYFRTDDLQEEENIFEGGYVSSLFAMELIMFLEGQYGIQVDNEDLNIENFQSVAAVARFITQKRGE